jgi:MFS superfamily sulfate permease-like transporter
MFSLPQKGVIQARVSENWKSALTVAFISVPLSIALSIASGAGPLPGLIAGIWGTLIGSLFIGSNYNILGAAGALTTVQPP